MRAGDGGRAADGLLRRERDAGLTVRAPAVRNAAGYTAGMYHLAACPDCKRQYDVSNHPEGERIRCLCGTAFPVVHHEPHDARAIRCSSCGAPLEDDERRCRFCESEFTIVERRLDAVCPSCYARLASDAKFCMECGVGIEPQALIPVPENAQCPRCEGELQSRDLGETSLVECTSCAGLWCPPQTFKRICREASQGASALRRRVTFEPVRHPFRYLKCPACEDMMVPRNFAKTSGIMIDVCRDHGVWLDDTELERIVAWVAENGAPSRHELGKKPVMTPNPDVLKHPLRDRGTNDSSLLLEVVGSVAEIFSDLFD